MSRLTIYNDSCCNSTVISNRFIDEYMKDANDAQLKIYLYLIRMLHAHHATSVSEIADKFNHTEKDVLRALKYWEKHQLLSLDYNEEKLLVGIHLQDLHEDPQSQAVATPTVSCPVTKEVETPPEPPVVDPLEKPSYSLDQIKFFKSSEDASQILFIAEQYLGKTLSASEIRTVFFFYDKLHFSTDLIDYLIQYCLERGKKDFHYIESVAISWAQQNVTTPKQAAALSKKYDKTIYTIMKTLGKSSIPTEKEMEFLNRWTKEFSFSLDIIIEACNRTVLATDNHRLEYADSILTNWHNAGVNQKSDIAECDKKFQKTKVTTSASTKPNNKFNQFAQNSYNYDELEKELISN